MNQAAKLTRGRKNTAGFSLIEALIAMLLFAVGFLAIAGLQLRGMQAARISFQRSTVVNLANDMADRIIANQAALAANREIYATQVTAAACYDPDDTSVKCNASQLAWDNYNQFITALNDAGLANVQVQICYDDDINVAATAKNSTCDNTNTTLVIKVRWNNFDASNLPPGEAASINTNFVYLPVLTVATEQDDTPTPP